MFRLRFEWLKPPSPPHTYDSLYEIALLHDDGTRVTLFEAALGGEEFVNWFLANEDAIRTEPPAFPVRPDESLPQAFWRAWDELHDWGAGGALADAKDPDDPAREALFTYRERHSSVFAAEGMAFPEFFFGIGADGPELSCIGAPRSLEPEPWAGDEWTWQYRPIDYAEFFQWLHRTHPGAPYPEPDWLRDEV